MEKVKEWNDFDKVISNISNINEIEFVGEYGKSIKRIIDLYGQEFIRLCEKYGNDIFKVVYRSKKDINFDNYNGNLEELLINDFYDTYKNSYYFSCDFEIFKKVVENGKGIFDENIIKLFSRDYPVDLLKKIYNNGNLKIYYTDEEFVDIMKNIEFEDYSPFLVNDVKSIETIETWLNSDELTVNNIIPLLRRNSEFYNQLCDKYFQDSESLEKKEEKNSLLIKYLNEYTRNGEEPCIDSNNLERYLFLSPEVLKDLIKDKNSREYKLVNLYGNQLFILSEKYGFEIFKKLYLNNSEIEIDSKVENLEEKFLRDISSNIKSNEEKIMSNEKGKNGNEEISKKSEIEECEIEFFDIKELARLSEVAKEIGSKNPLKILEELSLYKNKYKNEKDEYSQ